MGYVSKLRFYVEILVTEDFVEGFTYIIGSVSFSLSYFLTRANIRVLCLPIAVIR